MNKRRVLILLAVLTIFTAISPEKAHAYVASSAPSAKLVTPQSQTLQPVKVDNRAEILQAYLEQYNSPLAPHAETFIKEADDNNLDWKWVAAIAGVESYYGQMIPPYSYNGWGYGVYGTNVRNFASWDDGISVVTKALRQEYMDGRGATNLPEIGATYASDPRWASKVQHFVDDIDQYAKRFDKPTLSISL